MKALCFAAVFILVFGACSCSTAGAEEEEYELTVERIFSDDALSPSLPSRIQWLPGGTQLSYFSDREVDGEDKSVFIIRDVPSGVERFVCIPDTMPVPEDLLEDGEGKFHIGSYEWSEDGRSIIFLYKGEIFTFDIESGTATRRTRTEEEEDNVTFSPDGGAFAFTRGNDLYFSALDGAETRITSTGTDTLYNGVLNWVYMEELFTRGDTKAYWWSPDGRAIAFLEIRDGRVPEFPLVDWTPKNGRVEMQRYPKPGDPNPVVRVAVYDLEDGRLHWIDPLGGEDGYIARVYWLSKGGRLAVETMNRDQNSLSLLFVDTESGDTKRILEETDSTWVNVTDTKHFYETEPRFLWSSERDGRSHLYLYDLDGKPVRRITGGSWDVTGLDGVDEKKGEIYFTGTEKSPLERHLYRISDRGRELRRITRRAGTHRIEFSPNHRYYLDYYSSVDTPTDLSVHDAGGKHLFGLGKAPEKEEFLRSLPKPEFLTVESGNGLSYQCQILKPNRFEPHKKYPVIVYTYGGPRSQVVRNSWGGSFYLWHAMMAERGYIIFSLDNRGTFGKGREWINPVYKRLGEIELIDQLAGVDYVKSLPYVDPDRIAVWGWSYGGFMTCLALCKAPGVFRAGVAVAPVADFRLYDSIYTERYMGRPQDNEEGYEQNAPLEFAASLESALLLVHGFDDNNVHMQNTVLLADKLIEAGKDFDMMIYPKKEHSIRGKAARTHLFNKITSFFEENL